MKWLSLEKQNMIHNEKTGSVNTQQSRISSLSVGGKEISPLPNKNCEKRYPRGKNQRKTSK
jgi:hypothetical protein